MNKIIKNIFLKDNNNTLGFIRIFFSIFGGLVVSYFLIMIISEQLKYSIFENIVIGIIILPFFWSAMSLYIIMSKTKFNSILKALIPAIVLYAILYIF